MMIKETLRNILAIPGTSGSEQAVGQYLSELVKPFADDVTTDALGSVIAVKHGAPGGKRVMLSAHMDQIGYVVTDVDDDGFLRVAAIGGVGVYMGYGHQVVFDNGVVGVAHLSPRKDGGKFALEDVFIDIGAAGKAEALARVQPGQTASVRLPMVELGADGDRCSAPTMDDRAACAVLVEILRAVAESPARYHTVIGVFTTQEEVGLRGATAAAYAQHPDEGIALDVTLCPDTPEADMKIAVSLGNGPAVKIMDAASISSPPVRDGLFAAAKRAGVAVQREVLPWGGTDAGAIQAQHGGIPAGTLSIPCRYVHSPVEMVSAKDMEGCVAVMLEYLKIQ